MPDWERLRGTALEPIVQTVWEKEQGGRTAPVSDAPPRSVPRDFRAALRADSLTVIAEIKRGSPSQGLFAPHLDPVAQAERYVAGGAAAISVLTEERYFHGSMEDLRRVRARVPLPVLCKDFVVCTEQIWRAHAAGADAILLIVGVLTDEELKELYAEATAQSLQVLVEVHSLSELKRALALDVSIIGINNRNLRDLTVDLARFEQLAPHIPEGIVRVAESGIRTVADARRMAEAGAHALLVGESLVRAPDSQTLLEQLRGGEIG